MIVDVSNNETVRNRRVSAGDSRPRDAFERPYSLYFLSYLLVAAVATSSTIRRVLFRALRIKWTPKSFLIDRVGVKSKVVKDNAKGWRALAEMYHYGEQPYKASWLGRLVDRIWFTALSNPRGVRNRLRVVTDTLERGLISALRTTASKVRIASLACGSAEAVVDAVTRLSSWQKERVEIMFVDIEQSALDRVRCICDERGICASYTRANVFGAGRILKQFGPQIVEMVGLLDYLDESTGRNLFKRIADALPEGGVFITGNIVPNPEAWFLSACLGWNMVYRTAEQLDQLCSMSFSSVETIEEPMGVFAVSLCRK